jgi:hypothetical protein
MSRLLSIAAAITALCLTAPLTAAPAAPSATSHVDPAALKAADRLLTAMNYDRMMERTCTAMVAQMGPMMKASIERETGEKVDDALIKRITDVQSDFMHEALVNSPQLRRAVATIYARHFTPAELDRLSELYKDPVMRKWTEVTPDASAEMLPLITGVMESRRSALEERIKAVVTDYLAQKGQAPTS